MNRRILIPMMAVAIIACSCTGLNDQTIGGVTAIVEGADTSLRYLAGGGSLDGHAAGWQSVEWSQVDCVVAEQMKDLVLALVDVGLPAVLALVEGSEFEAPEYVEPDYDARCADIKGYSP